MAVRYEQRVPVLFGNGVLDQLGSKVKELGCRRVMCVYDAGVKAAGIAPRAERSLREAGVEFAVFDKIVSDPSDLLVNECGALALEADVDGFIGIGGGSSMDCAKAASLLLNHPAPIQQYFTAPPSFYECSVPVILVPTTAGTGSECTQVAVITRSSDHAKPSLFLRTSLAIVDPELTLTVPPGVTASTGLDAFTHAAEAITARGRDPLSELMAAAAIRKIAKYLPRAVADGSDREARYELSLAANWAGIAFANTDCHLGHVLADGLSAEFRTPHGYNCIVVNAELMRACAAAVPEKVRLVGEAAGVVFGPDDGPEQVGDKTAARIRELMRACGVESPAARGMERDRFLGCAGMCMEIDLGLRLNCPLNVDRALVEDLYARSYDNYH